jgi:hypothetical protein
LVRNRCEEEEEMAENSTSKYDTCSAVSFSAGTKAANDLDEEEPVIRASDSLPRSLLSEVRNMPEEVQEAILNLMEICKE